jgi:hypothetical protein
MLKMSSRLSDYNLIILSYKEGISERRSAIKSAAVFDGAHIRIFWPFYLSFTQLAAIAATTKVLPQPGGP